MSANYARQLRPVVTLQTPLGDVPEEWLRLIEPKISRYNFLKSEDSVQCWIWTGTINENRHRSNSSYPVIWVWDGVENRDRRAKVQRFICQMFWDVAVFDKDWQVHQFCGTSNCVNPSHFKPVFSHQTQRGNMYPKHNRHGRYE